MKKYKIEIEVGEMTHKCLEEMAYQSFDSDIKTAIYYILSQDLQYTVSSDFDIYPKNAVDLIDEEYKKYEQERIK